MQQKTIAVGKNPTLKIGDLPGDLRLKGWERDEIQAKTSGDVLEIVIEDETVSLTCDDDLIISLPQTAKIEIGAIAGDASIRSLATSLNLTEIGGDLVLRHVGKVDIRNIGGDLVMRHGISLKVDNVGDDASIRGVTGDVFIANVGSDLHLREVQGNLEANIGDDAVLYLHPHDDATYQVNAGDDIMLRLAADSLDVEMTLSAGNHLAVNLPDVEKTDDNPRTLSLGLATAKLTFSAGNDLRVTNRANAWEDFADFDTFVETDFSGLADNFAENISGLMEEFPDTFVERFSEKLDTFPDEFVEKIISKVDSSTRKMDQKMRQAEHKMRRAEHKARRAARQAERKAERHKIKFRGIRPPNAPTPPSSPVSEDERLLILKMLEEKKISASDAEKLLSALEA